MSSRGKGRKPVRGGGKNYTPSRVLRSQEQESEGMWGEPREEKEVASSEEESSEDEHPVIKKATAVSIETQNPNHVQPKQLKASDLDSEGPRELSRREREQMEKEQAKERYWKLHAEGKTEQARSDLARLALVRKQREEAAKKRAEEAAAKGKPTGAKADSLNAGKSIIKKRLG